MPVNIFIYLFIVPDILLSLVHLYEGSWQTVETEFSLGMNKVV